MGSKPRRKKVIIDGKAVEVTEKRAAKIESVFALARSCKPQIKKIDDCHNCVYYRQSCNGRKMYKEKISARGFVRCANQKTTMTEAEIEAAIAAGNT